MYGIAIRNAVFFMVINVDKVEKPCGFYVDI